MKTRTVTPEKFVENVAAWYLKLIRKFSEKEKR